MSSHDLGLSSEQPTPSPIEDVPPEIQTGPAAAGKPAAGSESAAENEPAAESEPEASPADGQDVQPPPAIPPDTIGSDGDWYGEVELPKTRPLKAKPQGEAPPRGVNCFTSSASPSPRF